MGASSRVRLRRGAPVASNALVERFRRCILLHGDVETTRVEALRVVSPRPGPAVLWVGEGPAGPCHIVPPREAARWLGSSFDAVVLDLHRGVDPDLMGQCHGFIRGGGRLVLRLPPRGVIPRGLDDALTVYPHTVDQVGHRFWRRMERLLDASDAVVPSQPIAALPPTPAGTAEQRAVVEKLLTILAAPEPALVALLSDRGRGKSSALGLALHRLLHLAVPPRIAVCAATPEAASEVFRFSLGDPRAPADPTAPLCFMEPLALIRAPPECAVIVVDEAAQLPVPILQRIALRHPSARIAFATTVRGYEGTGRGFVLRFLDWARRLERPLVDLRLEEPVRWAAGDPLERLVHRVLALDAEPAALVEPADDGDLEHVQLDRDRLADDDVLLEGFFGLLVHAHYRTTPGDLHRALDAPNIALHALVQRGVVVAASLVAREGGLPASLCDDLAHGRGRIRGHALADTLITHAGHPEAGALRMIRSVRTAVHPALRRRGLARLLVDHVHRSHDTDLFGTVFGGTPELIRFRRALGYQLVRLGVSRGSRSGEAAAVMVRPVTPSAVRLVEALRRGLALALPRQLDLLCGGGDLLVDPVMRETLCDGLPRVPPLSEQEARDMVAFYLRSPQPFEVAAHVLIPFVQRNAGALGALDPRSRRLVEDRVLAGRPWAEVAGYDSVPAAMRALRPALRRLAAVAEPGLMPER